MVCYLADTGRGVENYAETGWDILDVPIKEVNDRIAFADPDSVHWKAKQDNVLKREQGYALDPASLPKRILWASGKDAIPDVLPWFAVSPRFRDLVEQFEPGVHQFVPVEIYKARDGSPVATYYWFIVCQRLDSVDREHTSFLWKAPKDEPGAGHWTRHVIDRVTLDMTEIPNAKLVFNNKQAANHHIWHDPHLLNFGNGLCSDAFAEAAISANFTGLSAAPRESV
jgi:hypothetical protein